MNSIITNSNDLSDPSETFNILLNNKSYLSFLINQVQGVFNHFECNHLSLLSSCPECVQEFMKFSKFKPYIKNLYNWFKQENFQIFNDIDSSLFYPTDIIHCFQSIHDYLKDNNSCTYFCSPWLYGVYDVVNNLDNLDNLDNVITIFESLCTQGHFETLKWFYKIVKTEITLQKCDQERIFIKACQQKKPTTPLILSWLLSLELFDHRNLYFTTNEAFITACKDNNFEVITFLLTLKGDLTIRSLTVGHALLDVCDNDVYNNKQLKIVQLLLELKGDQKIFNHVIPCALKKACEKGHVEVVRFLLLFHDYSFKEAFHLACKKGHVEVVRLLLSLEGDQRINNYTVIKNALESACYFKHEKIVRLFLELKGDQRVNQDITNGVVFTYSCSYGFLDVVKLLLDLEEDRKVKQYSVIERGFRCACRDGQLEIVQLFLELKGNQKITQDTINKYAFQWACENGHIKVVQLLLTLEGDQRVSNETIQKKALYGACRNRHINIIWILLELEGDRRIGQDIINGDALRIVKWLGYKEVVTLLELKRN